MNRDQDIQGTRRSGLTALFSSKLRRLARPKTLLLTSLLLLACGGPERIATDIGPFWMGESDLKPEVYQLDNGLTVIQYEDHSAPVVAIQMWVAVGSADEDAREAGLAHVHEHMLFRGTERRGVGEIASQVESLGGSINAWTSYDQTVYHIVTASRFADAALDILADAIGNSTFDEEELQRELDIIQEEIKQGEDIPSQVFSQAMFRTAYSQHPYGRPIIGTRESVASFGREDVLQFYHHWYQPEFMTLIVVGDIDPQHLQSQIDELFGSIEGGNAERPERQTEPEQTETRVTLNFDDVQESRLSVAFHAPGLADEDIPALELLVILLGQGESSILFRELKRHRMMATDVYSYLYTPREPGILLAGASFPNDDVTAEPMDVLDALLREIFKLRHITVSGEDLRRAKTMLESETVYEIQTVQGRAGRMGYFHVVAGDLAFEQRFFQTAAQVTPTDIRRVAQRYLHPENLTVGFMLPPASADDVTQQAVLDQVAASYTESEQLGVPSSALVADEHGVIRHQFPGGLTVLIQEDHAVGLVALRAVFQGGLRFEDKGTNGINHFIAELLTGGTESRTSQEIATEIESMAGGLSGFSGRNSVGLQMVVLSRHFEPAFELFADCALHSQFPQPEVERIRREILTDIQAQQDDLAGSAFRQMNRHLFRGHPLQLDLLGTRTTIERLQPEALTAYYQEHFQPGLMVLSVVGDVSPPDVVETVERVFDVTQPGQPLPVDMPALGRVSREEVVTFRDRQQAHLVLGFRTVPIDHPDRWVLEVLSAALSAQGGRLFVEMRERQSLAYSVGALNMAALDSGYFAAYVATSPERIEQARASLERELLHLHDELLDGQEVARAQQYLVGQQEISLQRASIRAAYLAFDEAYGLGYDDHFRFPERILSVTPQDIQRVAREYLVLDQSVLSVVRPPMIHETPSAH